MLQAKPAFAVLSALLVLAVAVDSAVGQGFLLPADGADEVVFKMPRGGRPIIAPGPGPRPFPLPQPIPRPQPQRSYKIKEMAINANVNDQVAKVQVDQTFVNTGNVQMEVQFVFPLPYDGAVDQLTFMVDGKEFEARLLDKDEARQIYESYVRRNQDPALMEWIGTGMFRTSVFPVPAGAERKVVMRYTQLLKKETGITEFHFPLRAAQYTDKGIEHLKLNARIESTAKIKNVYSPSHPVMVERPDDRTALLKYDGSNETPTDDFRLLFDIGKDAVGASVLSYRPEGEEGYFLMMVSPDVKQKETEVARKTVLFVVDRSGSMSGKKIEQAKGALKFVMNNLNEGDLFNIVAYDSVVETFETELQKYDEAMRKKALAWVDGIYAGGSTNIDGALKAALGQLKDDQMPSYVLFLTDGLPTAGDTTKAPQIVANAKERNNVRARIFSFGVGYDVNSRLLDKLSRECFGQSEYVRPNEDIEASVSSLYAKIGSPVMTDVQIAWDLEGAEEGAVVVNRHYPKRAYDLFAGQQLVVVGRYKSPGVAKVTITGDIGGEQASYDFAANLVKESKTENYAFIEKLWATRRVGEIIDDIDLVGKNEELIDELVSLSKEHGIITPYTSFLAEEDNVALGRRAANARAEVALDALQQAEGQGGFAQRANKAQLQRAANAPAGGVAKFRDAADKEVVLNTVQNVGNKTFFRRGEQWVDSTVSEEQFKNAEKVERYSKTYFDLVEKHGRDAAKYLAIEGKVVVRFGDTAYAF